MLQCILTGTAQEAYSAICTEESLTYVIVKSVILKAYELVPKVSRQKFRHWVKGERQTDADFVHDFTSHFHRWCSAAKANDFESLCELIILEQFKNAIPPCTATYVNEHEPPTALKAAELADVFVLEECG